MVRPKEMWERHHEHILQEDIRMGLFIFQCDPKIYSQCKFQSEMPDH